MIARILDPVENSPMLFRRTRTDADFAAEIDAHIELEAERLRDEGLSDADARAAARRAFGNVTHARERFYESSRWLWWDHVRQGVRHGVRMLRRSPGFTAIAIVTLALGIGATTAVFSVIQAVLLTPPPYPDADRIVMVWHIPPPAFGSDPVQWSELQVAEFRTAHATAPVAAFESDFFDLGRDSPQRVDGIKTSAALFPILGVQPALGRVFGADEDAPGQAKVVVLSDALWRRQFAADPGVVGRMLILNGEPHIVVGVMPRGFAFPLGAEMPGNFQFPSAPELWVPLALPAVPRRGPSELLVAGRLAPGRTLRDAQSEFDTIRDRLDRQVPSAKGWSQARMVPLTQQSTAGSRTQLLVLMGAVSFLLLIACTNVSNLVLARAIGRARELCVRHALGATRGRLIRQLLAESFLLSTAGAAAGLALAGAATRLIVRLASDKVPRIADAHVNAALLAFTLFVTCVATLFFSVLPALRIAEADASDALRSGSRAGTDGAHRRAQRLLVIVEMALAVVLLGGAGFLIRSFEHLLHENPGFHAEDALTFEVTLPPVAYPDYESRREMFQRLLERLAAVPGVSSAGMGNLPLTESQDQTVFVTEDNAALGAAQQPLAEYVIVSPAYFRSLGIPIVAGRDFQDTDTTDKPAVVMLNRTAADRLWPGRDPLGRRLRLQSNRPWMTVVGIVPDLKMYSLGEAARTEMFVPYQQRPYPSMTTMQFVVRTAAAPAVATAALREALRTVDPSLPLAKVRPMEAVVAGTLEGPRFAMLLFGVFAALGLTLAATGIYGVLSHHVALQTRDIGVRMAIGALPGRVLRAVMAEGLTLAGIGAACGVAGTFVLGRAMRGLLFGITELDPTTYLVALVALLLAAVLGCYFPARAAMRIEPLMALRQE